MIKSILLFLVIICVAISCSSTVNVKENIPDQLKEQVLQAMENAGNNKTEIRKCFDEVDPRNLKELYFLIANMPEKDLKSLSSRYILDNLNIACEVRRKAPWKNEIPEDIFLNNVLPYCMVDEQRDPIRKKFNELFSEEAWNFKTPGEAAVYLNKTVFKKIGVKYHGRKRKKPNQSSIESIQIGFASCTGLSIILVDACRAVGIPARIAGIPAWKDKKGDAHGNHGGNHNWVEIWNKGKWHHLGASEPSELNKTWFTKKTATASDSTKWYHRIYGTSYKKTGKNFPLVWNLNDKSVHGIDLTEYYQKQKWNQKSKNYQLPSQ